MPAARAQTSDKLGPNPHRVLLRDECTSVHWRNHCASLIGCMICTKTIENLETSALFPTLSPGPAAALSSAYPRKSSVKFPWTRRSTSAAAGASTPCCARRAPSAASSTSAAPFSKDGLHPQDDPNDCLPHAVCSTERRTSYYYCNPQPEVTGS